MVTRTLVVTNDLGPRARAAALMAITINPYSSKVEVRQDNKVANARSILDLMLLGASSGKVIHVTASGEDEEFAIAAITSLVLAGFGWSDKRGGPRW